MSVPAARGQDGETASMTEPIDDATTDAELAAAANIAP
jgi:hypothetical protein